MNTWPVSITAVESPSMCYHSVMLIMLSCPPLCSIIVLHGLTGMDNILRVYEWLSKLSKFSVLTWIYSVYLMFDLYPYTAGTLIKELSTF